MDFLEPLGIDTREWSTATMDVIKFVRKVNAEWDEEANLFRPCDQYQKDEEWMIHWIKADKFIELTAMDQTGIAWKLHLEKVRKSVPGAKMLLVLEGLTAVFGRAKLARDRLHDAAVRAHLGDQSRANNKDNCQNLDIEYVENVLIEMQLVHEIRIQQTSSVEDSAEWISILAIDIASIPYRYVCSVNDLTNRSTRMFLDRTFCMENGQIKPGSGAHDVFNKMLQHVRGVTPQVAESITGAYKSVPALILAFQRGGPEILEDLPVTFALFAVC
jgi:hypothetical protein